MARSTQGFSGSRHTFLTEDDLKEASALLKSPLKPPTGDVRESVGWCNQLVSRFLSEKVLGQFQKHPLWNQAHPILLGSWGRNELCPKSDLDLLFLGEAEIVLKLVSDLQNQGFRIRYRIPEDKEDWSIGVLSTDVLALWNAQGLTSEAHQQLLQSQKKIFLDSKLKKRVLKDLLRDRKDRAIRLDSIQNFLEPQIKFGAGGLRDIFQGQVILDLFAEKFKDSGYEKEVLEYYRLFFLTLRQKLHLNGFSDVLVATEQFELSKWMGYQENSEFMRQIQRGLSRVHFYSEWILARAQASEKRLAAIQKRKIKHPQDLLRLIKKDPSILSQYQVRLHLDDFTYSAPIRGQGLKEIFSSAFPDPNLQAVFRSRLIDKLCPRMSHLVGLVQHDQYHRFTADAHLLQACREAKRLDKKGQILGPLKSVQKELRPLDWQILNWTALYHDLGKGMKGEHSEIGEKWVQQDLKSFGFPKSFRDEVAWLVRHHLELSIAAFRKNPQSSETWQYLLDLGMDEKRLLRLAIWTAIDIRATNPEAWTNWKAKLLSELVGKIRAGGTQNFFKLKKSGLSPELIEQIDPLLFEIFAAEKLKRDIEKVAMSSEPSWAVHRDSRKKTWIRYHQVEDRPGLLSGVVEKIYSSGTSIQQALIHTLPQVGVYDWFQVQTQKEPQAILKLLSQMKISSSASLTVQFMKIEIVSQSDSEWVLSFRGVDQRGLLLAATLKLKELKTQIKSARVHTWGRQIEDLFHIVPPSEEPRVFLEKLKAGLIFY